MKLIAAISILAFIAIGATASAQIKAKDKAALGTKVQFYEIEFSYPRTEKVDAYVNGIKVYTHNIQDDEKAKRHQRRFGIPHYVSPGPNQVEFKNQTGKLAKGVSGSILLTTTSIAESGEMSDASLAVAKFLDTSKVIFKSIIEAKPVWATGEKIESAKQASKEIRPLVEKMRGELAAKNAEAFYENFDLTYKDLPRIFGRIATPEKFKLRDLMVMKERAGASRKWDVTKENDLKCAVAGNSHLLTCASKTGGALLEVKLDGSENMDFPMQFFKLDGKWIPFRRIDLF